MYKKIYKTIKQFDTIVIARHIGVDPDALSSEIALRDSIRLTFPEKKVYAVGAGSSKFSHIGTLDKLNADPKDALLIVTDTPDKRRVDVENIDEYKYKIKIDHHPFIEEFCDIECIEDTACSVCEIIMDLIKNTKLECNKEIAETLFIGLVADSNRFLFDSCTPRTFSLVSYYLEKYKFSVNDMNQKVYKRPLKEVRLEGYMGENMVLTKHGVGYMKVTNDILDKFKVDSASPGNIINNFNFIDEVLVWVTMTEDIKNEQIRISIRSRGPIINKVAEKYNGGGHAMASGAKPKTFKEAMKLIDDLDKVTKSFIEEKER